MLQKIIIIVINLCLSKWSEAQQAGWRQSYGWCFAAASADSFGVQLAARLVDSSSCAS